MANSPISTPTYQALEANIKNAGGVSIATRPTVSVKTSGIAQSYTVPTGCQWIRVRMVGNGGNGGAAAGSTAGGGGGAGGYVEKIITSVAGITFTYTIGAPTTFSGTGVSLSAGGGSAGTSSTSSSAGGTGGSASGGDVNIAGMAGGLGWASGAIYSGGVGANSPFGGGGSGGGTGSGNGVSATGYGAGGGGAVGGGGAGNATAGVIIIEEYYS